MKKHIFTASSFIVFLIMDIITKNLVEKHIHIGERINVIGEFFQFTLIYNQGGVFGIMQGKQTFFLVVSSIVLLVLLGYYYFEKNKTILFCTAMGMIFSGAVGNILDRLLGKIGVVDFIWVGIEGVYKWPAFNVADSAIVVGAFLLIYVFYMQEKELKKQSQTSIEENTETEE